MFARVREREREKVCTQRVNVCVRVCVGGGACVRVRLRVVLCCVAVRACVFVCIRCYTCLQVSGKHLLEAPPLSA